MIKFALLLPLLCFANNTFIRSLNNNQSTPLKNVLKENTLAVLFQADCASCRKQIDDLKCLKDKYHIVLLGAFSGEEKLRKEARKYHSEYRSYYADEEVLKAMKIKEKASPQLIFYHKDRALRSIGKKRCEDIL